MERSLYHRDLRNFTKTFCFLFTHYDSHVMSNGSEIPGLTDIPLQYIVHDQIQSATVQIVSSKKNPLRGQL